MAIDKELLEILRCPESRAPLVLDGDHLVSTDPGTRRRYRIQDDIPDMILEDSEVLDPETWQAIMERHGVPPAEGEGS